MAAMNLKWFRENHLLITSILFLLLAYFLVLLPELALNRVQYKWLGLNIRKNWTVGLTLYGLAGLALTLAWFSRPKWLCVFLLAFNAIGQSIWISSILYFGQPTSPNQLLLALGDLSHTFEYLLDEAQFLNIRHTVLISLPAICFILQLILLKQARTPFASKLNTWTRFGAFAIIMAHATHVAAHPNRRLSQPEIKRPAVTGHINTLALAARMAWKSSGQTRAYPEHAIKVTFEKQPDEPITVVLYLGESLSPFRTSLFNQDLNTTPELVKLSQNTQSNFKLFAMTGFSHGVSTIASLPSLMRLADHPAGSELRKENIFEIAREAGFTPYYFATQVSQVLDLAGGQDNIERIETLQKNKLKYKEKRDDLLLDFTQSIQGKNQKAFIVYNPLVLHVPYTKHCKHLPFGTLPLLTYKTSVSDRIQPYDVGMQCFDRNFAMLLKELEKRKGKLYVFALSDHGELFGENGSFGHSLTVPLVSLVPMMLYTNDTTSPVTNRFAQLKAPSAFEFMQVVMQAMGAKVTTATYRPDRLYVNAPQPFGRMGYMEITRLANGGFSYVTINAEGQRSRAKDFVYPEILKRKIIPSDFKP
jgi:glucan phosphoethanolaminetransferase (alkaline phosphatase superfamily)